MPSPGLLNGLPLLLAIVYIGLLLLTFMQIEQRNRWLLLFLGLSGLWQFLLYLSLSQEPIDIPSKILLLCAMALGGATAVYSKRQPSQALIRGGTLLLLVTIFSDIIFNRTQLLPTIDIAKAIRLGAWLTFTLAILVFSRQQFQQTRSPWQANRLLFWMAALLIVFSAELGVMAGGIIIALASQLLRLGGAVMLLYAATHRQIFDVHTRLRKIAGVLITTAVTAMPTIIAVILSPLYLTQLSTPVVLLIVLLNLLFFVPLFTLIGKLINRFLFDKRIDSGQIVRHYSRLVANTLEINELAEETVGVLKEFLHVEHGALMLSHTNESSISLEPVPTVDTNFHEEHQFDHAHIFFRILNQQMPILRDEIEHDFHQEVSEADLNWFKLTEMEAYAPILVGDEIAGVLAIGSKKSGAIFQQGELDLLQLLAEQTSVALQNARLYRQLETQNENIRKLNESLQRQNKHLALLDQVKIDFISIASHELRTPLTQVKGYADLLAGLSKDGTLTSQQTYEIMTNIDRASAQLERVIAAMLDASQLDVDDVQLDLSTITLTLLLETAVAPYRTGLMERRIKFTTENVAQLPAIEVDFKRMGQALTNIIGNAIKFTPDRGHIKVTSQLVEDIKTNSYIELIIVDSGIGIDPQYHELIFEKFFRIGATQLHSSGNTKFKGAGPGLGLHIAKAVITAHGGRVWVESSGEDEVQLPGSEFHIILPIQQGYRLKGEN